MSILDKIRKELQGGLTFMEGKEKAVIQVNENYLINNFGFLEDKVTKEEYSVFTVFGDDKHFYFGGSVVTQKLKKITNCLSDMEMAELMEQGLPVRFISKKSDKNRRYIDLEVL